MRSGSTPSNSASVRWSALRRARAAGRAPGIGGFDSAPAGSARWAECAQPRDLADPVRHVLQLLAGSQQGGHHRVHPARQRLQARHARVPPAGHLGMRVLARGIVFIDLAVAQIAALGVVIADYAGFEARGAVVQLAALTAALCGAGALSWTKKRWPELQEALIGVSFVLAATAAILVLAHNPHGGENLRDLLSGQILWVSFSSLAVPAVASAAILVAWFAAGSRHGSVIFYVL